MAWRRARSAGHEQEGQALVEMAIVVPVFLLVLFGLIDVGRLVFTNATVSQAAREGARVAAAEVGWIGIGGDACVTDESQITAGRPGAHVCPNDVTSFKSHVADAANRMTATLGPITDVYVSCNAGSVADPAPSGDWDDSLSGAGNGCKDVSGNAIASRGDIVTVRVEYDYQTFTPIINTFITTVPLSGSATMIVN